MRFLTLIHVFAFTGAFAQLPPTDSQWQLVFNEDFNNLNYWTVFDWYDGGSNGSVALTKDVNIVNGECVFTANKEFTTCPYGLSPASNTNYPSPWWACNSFTYDFNHGEIHSLNNNFHYGYYEARIKADYDIGHWPSFFLLAGDGTSSSGYSEIDIFEMVGQAAPTLGFLDGVPGPTTVYPNGLYGWPMNQNDMTTNVHGLNIPYTVTPPSTPWFNPTPQFTILKTESPGLNTVNDYTQWHVYGLEWLPGRIVWYVDGEIVRRLNTPGWFNDAIPMQVVLGTSLRASLASTNTSTGDYPSFMYVDYFRYYQLMGNCSPAVSQSCYNFSSHSDITKLNYSIGNGCNNSVPSDKLYIFRGRDYVEINGEFTVPLGSQVFLDVDDFCATTTITTGDCGPIFNSCNFNFFGYNNAPKYLIDLADSGSCSITVQPTDNVKLWAKEYIHLQGDFSVPLNSEIEIKVVSCQ